MSVKIHLGTVNITEKTRKLMSEALDAALISQGHYTRDFEDAIKKEFGAKHALVTSSGTMADTVMLASLKYLRPNQTEVILPALTFIAHVNAIYYNHLKPVFVDVGPDFQIDVKQVEAKITKNTLAIMPANLLGAFADIEALSLLAKKHGVFLVTDDCEAFGSTYKGEYAGTLADAGAFSFFASHTICCGEGGMVMTNNDEIAEKVVAIRNHGYKGDRPEEKFMFPWIGFNAKMNNMEAIIGLGAMENLHAYIARRKHNYKTLRDGLGVDLLPDTADAAITPHCFPTLFKDETARNTALQKIFDAGIECRRLFSSVPEDEESYRFLGYKPGAFPVARDLSHRGLYLPIHQNLTDDDLAYMIETVKPLV